MKIEITEDEKMEMVKTFLDKVFLPSLEQLPNKIIKRRTKTMKSKKQIEEWIIKNCVDHNGDINLTDLDFSDFDGNVYLDRMKVKKDLHQSSHQVGGMLYQMCHVVKEELHQSNQQVYSYIDQCHNRAKGPIYQNHQFTYSDIYQDDQTAKCVIYKLDNFIVGDYEDEE